MIHSVSDMAGTIVVVLIGLYVGLVSSDADYDRYGIEQFQYPCYVDICTFPTQFCNSDRFERRCSPCTKAICRERQVPLACKYICRLNNIPPTTTTTTTAKTVPTKASASSNGQSSKSECSSSFLLLAYSATSTTIIVVVLVIILTCLLLRHSKMTNKAAKLIVRERSFKSGVELQDVEQQKSLVSDVTSRLLVEHGVQPAAGDSPPSYSTDVNQDEDSPVLVDSATQASSHVHANRHGQASSHVHADGHGQGSSHMQGSHRQMCSGYTTNASPDRDPNQHEKAWEVTQSLQFNSSHHGHQGARPKQLNQTLNNANQDVQVLTRTHQPESALNLHKVDNKQWNNTLNDRNTDHGSEGLPSQGTLMGRVNSNSYEESDSDSEETSLKS